MSITNYKVGPIAAGYQYFHMLVGPQIKVLLTRPEIDQRYAAARNLMLGLIAQKIGPAELTRHIPDLVEIFQRDELAFGAEISPHYRNGGVFGNNYISETDRSQIPAVAATIKANILNCLGLLGISGPALSLER
jgi:hypothetical protein